MQEIWKDVKDFEGLYQISNMGRIKRLSRKVNTKHRGYIGYRILEEKILNYSALPSNYIEVCLSKNNKYYSFLLHRLVALTFIPNPDNLPCVNHKDENKQNNCVDNLEWCTHKYNNNYGNRNKKISNSRKGMKFSKEHRAKISYNMKHMSEQTKEKIRQAHLGKKLSEEHKKKIGEGVRRNKNKVL